MNARKTYVLLCHVRSSKLRNNCSVSIWYSSVKKS